MRSIAFYLPQYHSIPENDKWWGKGFTEWTNVKKAKPLFKKHIQPEVPLDIGYYDLSDDKVMVKQAQLAKSYGLYGFCYYHYWFEGKLLLEKPLEQMLNNNNIDIPFCICWANETWSRTWNGSESDILIKQNYNEDITLLRSHFDYLLKYFKDDRYISKDNRPMLIIYKPHLVTNLDFLMSKWNEWAIEEGFNGVCFGFQHHSTFENESVVKKMDFGIEFEPWYTAGEINKRANKNILYLKYLKNRFLKQPNVYNYDDIWKEILNRPPLYSNIMPGAFTSWDNTPRKGANATIFYEATPDKFQNYLIEQINRAKNVYNSDYIFINAWNEWGEGAHLEPDEYNKYGYLQALKYAMSSTF